MPVPAGPMPKVTVQLADRVDVALLRDGLRRDLLAAVPPDDVLEDVADVGRLVERAEHGVDRVGADLVAALDELDELVDDRARLGDLLVVALERQQVAAQPDRAARAGRAASRARRRRSPASSAATSFETSRTSCTPPV